MTDPPPLLPSYRRHLDHVQSCPVCRRGDHCPKGRDLERAWHAERSDYPGNDQPGPEPDQA